MLSLLDFVTLWIIGEWKKLAADSTSIHHQGWRLLTSSCHTLLTSISEYMVQNLCSLSRYHLNLSVPVKPVHLAPLYRCAYLRLEPKRLLSTNSNRSAGTCSHIVWNQGFISNVVNSSTEFIKHPGFSLWNFSCQHFLILNKNRIKRLKDLA